jgi:hypothetical protein
LSTREIEKLPFAFVSAVACNEDMISRRGVAKKRRKQEAARNPSNVQELLQTRNNRGAYATITNPYGFERVL